MSAMDIVQESLKDALERIRREAFEEGRRAGRREAAERAVRLAIYESHPGYTDEGMPIRTAWVDYLVWQLAAIGDLDDVPPYWEDHPRLCESHETSRDTQEDRGNIMKTLNTDPLSRVRRRILDHEASKQDWAHDCTAAQKRFTWVFYPSIGYNGIVRQDSDDVFHARLVFSPRLLIMTSKSFTADTLETLDKFLDSLMECDNPRARSLTIYGLADVLRKRGII